MTFTVAAVCRGSGEATLRLPLLLPLLLLLIYLLLDNSREKQAGLLVGRSATIHK